MSPVLGAIQYTCISGGYGSRSDLSVNLSSILALTGNVCCSVTSRATCLAIQVYFLDWRRRYHLLAPELLHGTFILGSGVGVFDSDGFVFSPFNAVHQQQPFRNWAVGMSTASSRAAAAHVVFEGQLLAMHV